jgi:hypothetical protein
MPLVSLLVYVAILAIVLIAFWYIIQQIAMPPPIRQIVIIVFVVIIAIVSIYILVNLVHGVGSLSVGFSSPDYYQGIV